MGSEMSKFQLLPLGSSETRQRDSPVQRRSEGARGRWAAQEADSKAELSMQGALGSPSVEGTQRKPDGHEELQAGLMKASVTHRKLWC